MLPMHIADTLTGTCYRYMLPVQVADTCYRYMLPIQVTDACHPYMLLAHVTDPCYRCMLPMHVVCRFEHFLLFPYAAVLQVFERG